MKENTTGILKNEEQAEFFLNETLQKAYKEFLDLKK